MADQHGSSAERAPEIVTNYDFKHPARVNKAQLRTLENLHDNFACLLSSTLSRSMRQVVDVDTAFVDQTTYAEFIMSLSNPSCSYQFVLGPTSGQAILDFSMPLVFAAIDRAMGGRGSEAGVDARQLSQIEMGCFARTVKQVIEDLEATWEPILHVEISDIELETNPEFMQITAPAEIVILIAFEVNAAHLPGRLISLCYPFFTIESILSRLAPATYGRGQGLDRDELRRQNRLRFGKTPLELRAELGRARVTAAQVRDMKPGDVIALDTHRDEPSVVYAQDEPKWLAVPYASKHGTQMLKVAAEIPREEEEVYRNRLQPVRRLP